MPGIYQRSIPVTALNHRFAALIAKPGVRVPLGGAAIAASQSASEICPTCRAKARPGGLLVVSRPAPLRHGAPLRLRAGVGTDGAVCHGDGQHSRRDSISASAEVGEVLNPLLFKEGWRGAGVVE